MKLIAFGNARLNPNSPRCKNKMLRPFAGTTLVEIAARRLSNLTSFDGVYFAVHEEKLLKLVRNFLPEDSIIKRSQESASASGPITLIHDYLLDLEFDYCMWVNSCHAFLKSSTLDEAAKRFRQGQVRSMTAVRNRYTWFYTPEGKSINNDPTIVSTAKTPPLFEVTHAFHLFEKDHFFKTASYWRNMENDPLMYVIDDLEALDIDTDIDFLISESVYKTSQSP